MLLELKCMGVEVKQTMGQVCTAEDVRKQCDRIRAPYYALSGAKCSNSRAFDQNLYLTFDDNEAPLHVPKGISLILNLCFIRICLFVLIIITFFGWFNKNRIRGLCHGNYIQNPQWRLLL